jgi:hypothetical protein
MGSNPLQQSVAENFRVATKSIVVDFTDQRVSAHAGGAALQDYLCPSGFLSVLEKPLPH